MTTEEYHYTAVEEKECMLTAYQVRIAGINGVGVGQYSQPMTFTLGRKLEQCSYYYEHDYVLSP